MRSVTAGLSLSLLFLVACASRPPAASAPPPGSSVASSRVDAALEGQRCGRASASPVVRQTWAHGRSDLCDAALTTWSNVPHVDRTCASDADCVVVAGDCFADALNRGAKAKAKYTQLPCANPASGACAPWVAAARCRQGCCSAER